MQSRSTYSSRLHFLETGRVDILRRLKGFGRRHLSLPLRLALRDVAAEYDYSGSIARAYGRPGGCTGMPR